MLKIVEVSKGPRAGQKIITIEWTDEHLTYYCGSGTVWHSYPGGRRQGSNTESKISDLMERWEYEEFESKTPS